MGFLRKIGSSKSLREKASKDAVYQPPTPPPQLPPLPDHIRRSESKAAEQSSSNPQQRAQRRRSRSLWATSDEAKVARTGLQRRDSFSGSTFTTDSNPASQPWRSRDAWIALHAPSTPTLTNELTFPCSLDPPTPGWRGRGGGGFFAGTESMTDAERIKQGRGDDGDSIYSLPPRSRSRAAIAHRTGSPAPPRSKLAYPTPPQDAKEGDDPTSPTLMPKTGLRRPSHTDSLAHVDSRPASAVPPRAVSPMPALPPTPTTPRALARADSVNTTARDSTSSGDHGSQSPVTPQQSTQHLQAPASTFLPSEAKVPWGQASRSASPILFRNDSTSTTGSAQSVSARSSVYSSRARVQHSPQPPSRALPSTPSDSESGHSNSPYAYVEPAYQHPRQHSGSSVDNDDEEDAEIIDFTRPRSPEEDVPVPFAEDSRRSVASSRGRRSSIQSSYDTHESFQSNGSAAYYTPPVADSPLVPNALSEGFFPTPAYPSTSAPPPSAALNRPMPGSGLVIPPVRTTSRPPSRSASRASRSSHGHSSQGHDMPHTPASAQYPVSAAQYSNLAQGRAGSVDSPSPAPAPQSVPFIQPLEPQRTGTSLRSLRRNSHVSTHTLRKSAGKAELASDAWRAASPGVPDPFAGPWEQPDPYEIGFNPEHQQYSAPMRLPQKGSRLPNLRGSARLAKAGWI